MVRKPHGLLEVYTLAHNGEKRLLFRSANQIQDDSAVILAKMLAGDTSVRIDTLYLEYQNVENADDSVTPVSFPASDGAEYFTDLSGTTDFIRHALTLTPEVSGDSVTFSAVIGDAAGYHGLPFGTGVNSRIYSAALAASCAADQTKDLIFSRKNWDTQKTKTDEQIYVVWKITFDN